MRRMVLALAMLGCEQVDWAMYESHGTAELGSETGDGLLQVTVPQDMPDADRGDVAADVAAWNALAVKVVGHELLRWDGTAVDPTVRRVPQAEVDRICGTTDLGLKAGCSDGLGGTVTYSDSRAVMHELGHFLWLDHVQHGVMQAMWDGSGFTEDDRNELTRVWR